ncbi:MAG: response regulator [Chloroflexi bacterium]|nr:response regulator [Chloroflexota bacterium]
MEPELRTSYLQEALDLLRNEICLIAFTLSVLLGLGQLVLAEIQQGPIAASALAAVMMVLPILLWHPLKKYPQATHIAIVAISLAIVCLSLVYFENATHGLLVLPGILASLLIGPNWGLAITGLAIGLILGLPPSPIAAPAASRGVSLVLIGSVQALVWGSMRYLRDGMEWSWRNYQRNAVLLEEARDQRLRLKQAQADLIQANNELARLNDRLAAMRLTAEEARRSKEEFVANVSHELRTPLNMILGFSEMITQSPGAYGKRLPAALLADIRVILRNAQHLSSMVDDVLDLARMDASPIGLRKQWVRVREIVQEAEEAVRPLFESKGLYLRSEVCDVDVYCDRTRIRQVLLNLLSNAARATEKGGVSITVQMQGDDNTLLFAVADTGPGIAPEDREQIFEPFRQAGDDVLKRKSGTGLGLTLSRRFVQLHGGKIWLESEVGVGSTFFFSIPRQPISEPIIPGLRRWFNPYTMHEARDRASAAPAPQPRQRYVIIESEHTLKRLIERYRGVEVVSVASWEEAAEELCRSPAHVLVVNEQKAAETLDLGRLKSLPYATPVVGCWVPGPREAAEALGVSDYLIKPVRRDDLIAAIERVGEIESVLIVDDDVEAVQLFSRMCKMSRPELQLLASSDARRAMTLLRQHRPDVVLLDLVMPGMTGYDFIREKNGDPTLRAIPIIAVSAQDPLQTPLGRPMITVSRTGGLSLSDLFGCIEDISARLAPSMPTAHPEHAVSSLG